MAQRTQSPSSINTYNQCPRKYFYQYIMKLTTKSNIHLVRGKAAHSVLENFFKVDIKNIHPGNYAFELKTLLFDMFRQEWEKSKPEMEKIGIEIHNQIFYYTETKKMFENWFNGFLAKLKEQMDSKSLIEAFKFLTPIAEKRYYSETHKVQGFIDAIHDWPEGVHILDYKTSSKDTMSKQYRLQLGIYAMLYHRYRSYEEYIRAKWRVTNNLEVDDILIEEAKKACKEIQEKTISEDKGDYPKKESPLCKWSTGQCDFFEHCVKDD